MIINPRHLNQFSPKLRDQVASAITHALIETRQQDARVIRILPMTGYYTSIVFGVKIETGLKSNKNPVWLYFKLANSSIESQKHLIEREFQDSLRASEYFKEQSGLHAIEPILWLSQEQGFVMTKMPGDRLDKFLLSYMRLFSSSRCTQNALTNGFNMAGQWLCHYQKLTEAPVDSSIKDNRVQLDISDYHRRVESLLLTFSNELSGYLDPQEIEQIHEQCLIDLRGFTDKELRLVTKHNDFAPWNINLIPGLKPCQPAELMVFDFADVKVDSVLYDVYYFIRSIQLYRFKFLINPKILPLLVQEFLAGYGLKQDDLSPHSARFFNLYFNLSSTLNLLRSQQQQKGIKRAIKMVAFHRYLKSYKEERRNILS